MKSKEIYQISEHLCSMLRMILFHRWTYNNHKNPLNLWKLQEYIILNYLYKWYYCVEFSLLIYFCKLKLMQVFDTARLNTIYIQSCKRK